MQQLSAILLDQQRDGDWAWITLGSPSLAGARAGQFVALRCALPDSYDPLLRQPLFVARADPMAGTADLLVAANEAAFSFLAQQARGAQLDLLGPLGHGWNVPATARSIALLGTTAQAAPLFALAHAAVSRGSAVSVLLGADERSAPPPPSLLPAAAEYDVARGANAAEAALTLLDDHLIRWADLLALALPLDHLTTVAQRVRSVRLQWQRDFAQAVALPPLACCIGVCGVCGVQTRKEQWLACTDGPVFDLRDLVR